MLRFLPMIPLLAGCTTWAPEGDDGNARMTTLPATVICVLSACDTLFSDRETRADGNLLEITPIQSDQKAEAAPTVSLPGGL